MKIIIDDKGDEISLSLAVQKHCALLSKDSGSCKDCILGYDGDTPVYLCTDLLWYSIAQDGISIKANKNVQKALKLLNWRLI